MIYRFRAILDNDTEDDIFRDLEIRQTDTLEDLHNSITQSFGLDGTEMASFYVSDDEWNQGEEISLFDMSEGLNSVRLMNETILENTLNSTQTKLIYIYDFFNMWTFLIELAEITDETQGTDYPNLIFSKGVLPAEPPKKQFEFENLNGFNEDEDEEDANFSIDDYDNLNFNENWN